MESKENAGERSIAAQRYAREGNYWLNKLSGEWLKSVIPYDFIPAAAGEPGQGQGPPGAVEFRFPGGWYPTLMKLSKGYDYTLHMIFTAVVTLLLDKYTANRDIIVGTTIYRQENEAEFIGNNVTDISGRVDSRPSQGIFALSLKL